MHADVSEEERKLVALIGAHSKHSQGDRKESTSAARAKLWQQYLHKVDPDGKLPPEERERRATHARRADMARLALKSVQARRLKAQAAMEDDLWGTIGGAA